MVFIMSNWQDSVVHMEGVSGNGFRINSLLDKGVYYYRVLDNGHLVKLGVVFVDER
jgi:hypothetical protein